MALLRRMVWEHLSEGNECGYDGRPCPTPSPPPPAPVFSDPVALVNATDFAPPPALLRVPATRINIEGKNHSLPMVVITVTSVLAACFLLLAVYVFLRALSSRRRRRRRGAAVLAAGGPPQPPFNVDDGLRQDLLVSLGGGEEPYHVWYIRTEGLGEPTIGAISVCAYKRGEGLVEGTDCAVCLGEFGEGELLRLLPKCSHAFHIPCIDTWLRSHVNCPLCRAPILAPTRPLPPPPHATDAGSNPGSAATVAAVEAADLVASTGVDPRGSESSRRQTASEVGSEEDGASAVLAAPQVAVDPIPPGSSFSSVESEIWMPIDLGNGGSGDDTASYAPHKEGSGDCELQPVRRSVSMDSSALAGLLFRMRLVGSSIDGRRKASVGEAPSATSKVGNDCKGASLLDEIERSMSGGRFCLSRFSGRAHGAILPL